MGAEQVSVLVTGANGFVGQAVMAAMLAGNYKVIAVTRRKAFEQQNSPLVNSVVSELDINTDWTSPLSGGKAIVHTAARVHIMNDTSSDPLAEFRRINTDATLNLARQAAEAGIKRFIFISTIKVNGEFTTPIPTFPHRGGRGSVPFQKKGGNGESAVPSPLEEVGRGERDAGNKPFDETDTPNPQDPYAISKWEAEQGLMQIAEETGMEVVIIRPPLVYGPGVKGNFATMMKWLKRGIPLPLGAVHNQRSLLALDNLVSFILLCLEHPKAANQTFVIADGEDVSTSQLLNKIAQAMNKRAWLVPVPVNWMGYVAKLLGKQAVAKRLFGSLQIDISKAKQRLGWRPVVSLDEQLSRMNEHDISRRSLP